MNVRSRSRTAAAPLGAAAPCLGVLSTPASADHQSPPWRPQAGVGKADRVSGPAIHEAFVGSGSDATLMGGPWS
ncbi:hypothetical protein ACFYXF_44555 [Streptomyces sp. NPDC002680]|uniref:hypothetical protein n=1 Tax=Streptomyces sp. NPDC002680 TaxID=3364659 RepID=UPI0036A362DA